ncbi:DUF3891 family protein [Bacillus sp. Marseille-P3661]|uniref:DUF3891 family protein n=1 Tax=Bacillus sp. Marseille-P3661 TaxID=1936234 RepID=UPI000C850D6F|nr:DUF3891 family protein [Bacillus sp. Marseille-P3661]
MIVVEQSQAFIMVTQHDHALISGEIAENWNDAHFLGLEKKEAVVLAIKEHDRGWIPLDKEPLWDPSLQSPYTFLNYPLEPKIECYRNGISEVEQMNKYAGLLCSLHFASFLYHLRDPISKDFTATEMLRQQKLKTELEINRNTENETKLGYHLNMLKLCDNLSLYICLNEPGVDKANEYPFFRKGFPQKFPFTNHELIIANWLDQETITLSISPLAKETEILVRLKTVSKESIYKNGLHQAYKNTSYTIRTVKLIQA